MKNNIQNDEFLRKRKARQKQIRRRRAKIFLFFFIITLILTGIVLSYTVLFPIDNITASGSKIYTTEQIIDYSKIEKGDNLFAASQKKTLTNLRQKLPFIESVKFKRILPGTLKITVTDAKEYLAYKIDKNYYTVSKNGFVLACYSKAPKNIIKITSKTVKCKVGTAVEFKNQDEADLTQEIVKMLGDNNITVNSIDLLSNQNIKAKVEGRFTVQFGTIDNLEGKVRHLKSMMKEIGENKSGDINLTMWNSKNTQGIFVQNSTK